MDDARVAGFARFAPVLGVVLLVLGVGAETAAALICHHTRAWVTAAARVEGTVVEVEPSGTNEDGDTMYSTTVRFTDAQGREHEVRSRSEQSPAPFAVGDTAPVLYPPGRPDEARIAIFGELYLLPLVFGVGAVGPLTGGLFFLLVYPRLARRPPSRREPSRKWFAVRMVVMALFFVGGALTFLAPGAVQVEDQPPWVLVLTVVGYAALTPFVVAGMLALFARLPWGRRDWERPTLSSYPDFFNPLVFFHFAGLVFAAVGLGTLLTSFMGGPEQSIAGAGALLLGLSVLAGVRFGERFCRERMASESRGAPTGP